MKIFKGKARQAIKDFLAFKSILMPHILQILFWAGIGGTLYGTLWLYMHGNWAWWMSLVFGTLLTRLVFESLLIKFKSYQALIAIEKHLKSNASTPEVIP